MADATNVLNFLINLRPAIPFSSERGCNPMSNTELRRLIDAGGVLINSEKVTVYELVDFPVFSIVFFPKGKRRTTIF